MSRLNGSKQPTSLCDDLECSGLSCDICEAIRVSLDENARIKCPHGVQSCCVDNQCDKCIEDQYPKHDQPQPRGGVVGGGKARDDVVPLQDVHDLCLDCRGNPDPTCAVCAMIKSTQEIPPFKKEEVKILHSNLGNIFAKLPKERRFNLSVRFDTVSVGTINWCFHNCAFTTVVQMLSNSNAGLYSINQQKFAGYLLALIANSLQENGRCEAILIEVFRLELTILSGNQAWSNWSELAFFGELYTFCVKHGIIIANDFIFVPPNDDGSSNNIGQVLEGKNGFAVLEAQNWSPSIENLSYGICSAANSDFNFSISSVVLYSNDHFSIVVISQGIWHIDGKGRRTGEFTAESTIRELSINEFQELCRQCGAFYFLEKVPSEYDHVHLGTNPSDIHQRIITYNGRCYLLYPDGTVISRETGSSTEVMRSVFVKDSADRWLRLFPPPHLPAPCAQVVRALPPPPPAPFEKVSQPLPPPPEPEAPTVIFADGFFRHIPYENNWTYTYQRGTVFFRAEGTFKDEPYSNRKYFYKGKEYCGSLIQTILRDACVEFLKVNLPK